MANRPTFSHRAIRVLSVLAVLLALSSVASAQLDPLLFIRRVPPTVVIAMDTGFRMLEDGSDRYYDPKTYLYSDDSSVATALGVASGSSYRRMYHTLRYSDNSVSSDRFDTDTITAVQSTNPAYATFYDNTRLEVAKKGIDTALGEYAGAQYRFGLIKLRQTSARWRTGTDCERPVRVTSNLVLQLATDSNPCNVNNNGRYGIYAPDVSSANYANETSLGGGAQVVAPAANTQAAILTVVRRGINDAAGLIPAGVGTRTHGDRPISHLLDDARTAVVNAMTADSAANRTCRNSVVVLLVGGKDDGNSSYVSAHNASAVAATFTAVTAGGVTKRVPIHVVAIRPAADHVASLQAIATSSGGSFRQAYSQQDVALGIHLAVQAGSGRSQQFDTNVASEFLPVSPVVGTVNLKDARSATGAALANTDITAVPGGQKLPQRSNVLLTSGFSVPGFEGVIRAFRTYVPEVDATKPTGWKFVNDGTRLWPDLDGRPWLAGRARTPADSATRNIFTYVPDGAGGGTVVKFLSDAATAAQLRPHLNVTNDGDAAALIHFVRSQPLGAIIGSTPAMMDAPSLDPPPDDAYGRADAPASFAGIHKDRRSMIFVGANDGMIHAIDARTGYEVWAFIPYNLLAKLNTLRDGQSVEQFDYFVDSSPKVAEVKIDGAWRSLLFIGQGPGGTFYQAFDVTSAGMGVEPERDDLGAVTDLLARFDDPDESISFKWAFPNYSSFDPTYVKTFTVADGTPGGKFKLFGDLKSSATVAEKTVGFTWSDPAVGPLTPDRSVNAVIVGSGYFPQIEDDIEARGSAAPRAGNALYLLDVKTGLPLGNSGGGSCPTIGNGSGNGNGCVNIGDVSGNGRKNALQADPTASGLVGSPTVTKAYLGDIDGKYWRFDFTPAGAITTTLMLDTTQPIYSSSALLFVGSVDVYMFFATGSDLLAPTAPGGLGTFKLYGLKDNHPAAGAQTKFALNLAQVTALGTLASGERPSTAPSVAGDIVFYSTTTENSATPCNDFAGKIYALTYVGTAAYDANNSGRIESNETPVVRTVAGRATAPFIVDQHLYIGTAGALGAAVEAFGDPQDFNNGIGQVGVRVLSWREIR